MKGIPHPIRPHLQVPVEDLRAAATMARAEPERDIVQVPDHSGCPPTNQLPAALMALGGVLTSVLAWFKEDVFGLRGKQKEKIDKLETQVCHLMDKDREAENNRLITELVEKRLAEVLKQQRPQESR